MPPATSRNASQRKLRLGTWIANQRSRAASLTPERVEQLSAVGMRWAQGVPGRHSLRRAPGPSLPLHSRARTATEQ
ncbi:helicase associated domain-containing protein [Streptomyces sp. NPDC006540]|uniref:helicase associated domain-containing protein n=1 Tax=Streptomyces sp. NPDC006540 TaxID=3155353 RepID=UPI0033AD10C2